MPRYEFSEGRSNKFWQIELSGASFTTTFGRIGAAGQSSTKTFESAAKAKLEYDKLVAEKVKKGYTLVAGKRAKVARGALDRPALKVTTVDDEELSIAELAKRQPEWLDDQDAVVDLVRRDAKPAGLPRCELPDHP